MSSGYFCPHCGGKIDAVAAVFCPHCGAALEGIATKGVPTAVVPQEVVQPTTAEAPTCYKYGHLYGGGMTGLKWLIIILTLCTVIIPIVLYLVWYKKRCMRCGMKEP